MGVTDSFIAGSFRILVTSETSGLIETITDAVSVHSIKKDAYARTAADGTQVFTSFTLFDHYVEVSSFFFACLVSPPLLIRHTGRRTARPRPRRSGEHRTTLSSRSRRTRSFATSSNSRIGTTATFSSTEKAISSVRPSIFPALPGTSSLTARPGQTSTLDSSSPTRQVRSGSRWRRSSSHRTTSTSSVGSREKSSSSSERCSSARSGTRGSTPSASSPSSSSCKRVRFFLSSLSLSGDAGADPELRDVKTRTCRASRTGTSRRSSFGSGSSSH